MILGILKEIKPSENRVAMTPAGVELLRHNGHSILVEKHAGVGSGFLDILYEAAGAEIVADAKDIYAQAHMVMHVKEPLIEEYDLIRKGQIVFTYLHLAANATLTEALIKSRAICIAYETIQKTDGTLPLLKPMSEVAGRMAIFQGAKYLEMAQGGHGVLLGGVPGVDPGTILIIGGGTVGKHAAKIACGLGAKVYVLDNNLERLRYLSDVMPRNCFPLMSTPAMIRDLLPQADVVVGAVLIPGAKAPWIITRQMLPMIRKGTVLVDVAIDQGGCFETSKPTTHTEPTFAVDGIVHYCVTNMPGAVANTSTMALTNATLPYAIEIANKGWQQACRQNPDILPGLNVVNGKIAHKGVAEALNLKYEDVEKMI